MRVEVKVHIFLPSLSEIVEAQLSMAMAFGSGQDSIPYVCKDVMFEAHWYSNRIHTTQRVMTSAGQPREQKYNKGIQGHCCSNVVHVHCNNMIHGHSCSNVTEDATDRNDGILLWDYAAPHPTRLFVIFILTAARTWNLARSLLTPKRKERLKVSLLC
jgi:hypothetical protein